MKPRIFLSTTFADTRNERPIVLQAAGAAGWEPVHFETTPGLDPYQVLRRVHSDIRSCDALLSLLTASYGSQAPSLAMSYVHFEYALARRLGKPIVCLLLQESEASPQETRWRSAYSEKDLTLSDLMGEIAAAVGEGTCLKRTFSRRPGATNALPRAAQAALVEARQRFFCGALRKGVAPSSHSPEDKPEQSEPYWFNRIIPDPVRARYEYSTYFWDYNLPLACFRGGLLVFFGASNTSNILLVALLQTLRWTQLYHRSWIRLFTNGIEISQYFPPDLKNGELHVVGGTVRRDIGSLRGEESDVRKFLRVLPVPRLAERGLYVCGVSLPPNSRSTTLASTEAFELTSAIPSLGCSSVLFLNPTGHKKLNISQLVSFLDDSANAPHRSVPLSVCVGARSVTDRDLAAAAVVKCGFDPIPPTYGDGEYRNSFPLIATNAIFRDTFGPLIG